MDFDYIDKLSDKEIIELFNNTLINENNDILACYWSVYCSGHFEVVPERYYNCSSSDSGRCWTFSNSHHTVYYGCYIRGKGTYAYECLFSLN